VTRAREPERGAALIVVLLALAVLLPIALGISGLVFRRQKQVARWQGANAGRLAVVGAFESVRLRVASREIGLRPGDFRSWEQRELGPRGVSVRVRREEDVAIRMDGQIVPAHEAEFGEQVIDSDGDVFCPWQRVEVYFVEAEAEGTAGSPSMRLLGGIGRLKDGRTLPLGYRVDRRGG
jgi:hypothetical protein